MPYLIAAFALVTALCLFNLLLTVGVIRRLREQARTAIPPLPDAVPAVGTEIGAFEAVTTGGDRVTEESLAPGSLVAFFSPGCTPCRERLPDFIGHASSSAVPPLAVVLGPIQEVGDMVAALEPVSAVVMGRDGDVVSTAFKIGGTPAFVTVAENKVVAIGLPEDAARV